MEFLPTVARAEYRGGHRIFLLFNDGAESTVDFSDWLTGPVFESLQERKARLQGVRENPTEELMRFLREEIWPKIPPDLLGRGISQAEQDEILGYGAGGV